MAGNSCHSNGFPETASFFYKWTDFTSVCQGNLVYPYSSTPTTLPLLQAFSFGQIQEVKFVARENGSYSFDALCHELYYGCPWRYRSLVTIPNGASCGNSLGVGDPFPGVGKQCACGKNEDLETGIEKIDIDITSVPLTFQQANSGSKAAVVNIIQDTPIKAQINFDVSLFTHATFPEERNQETKSCTLNVLVCGSESIDEVSNHLVLSEDPSTHQFDLPQVKGVFQLAGPADYSACAINEYNVLDQQCNLEISATNIQKTGPLPDILNPQVKIYGFDVQRNTPFQKIIGLQAKTLGEVKKCIPFTVEVCGSLTVPTQATELNYGKGSTIEVVQNVKQEVMMYTPPTGYTSLCSFSVSLLLPDGVTPYAGSDVSYDPLTDRLSINTAIAFSLAFKLMIAEANSNVKTYKDLQVSVDDDITIAIATGVSIIQDFHFLKVPAQDENLLASVSGQFLVSNLGNCGGVIFKLEEQGGQEYTGSDIKLSNDKLTLDISSPIFKSIYLAAISSLNPTLKERIQFDLEVCGSDTVSLTTLPAEEFKILIEERTAIVGVFEDKYNYAQEFQSSSSFCQVTYKLLDQDGGSYIGNQLDLMNGQLRVDTSSSFMPTKVSIEASSSESTSKVSIPFLVEVCGWEKVQLLTSLPDNKISITTTPRDETIKNSYSFSSESDNCPIVGYKLVDPTDSSLEVTSTQVRVNSQTGEIEIDLNQELSLKASLKAFTKSGTPLLVPIEIELKSEDLPPTFESKLPSQLEVKVTLDEEGNLEQGQFFTYKSPKAVDSQGGAVTMLLAILGSPAFASVSENQDSSFQLIIDRKNVTKETAGKPLSLIVTIDDQKNQFLTQLININVVFESKVPVLEAATQLAQNETTNATQLAQDETTTATQLVETGTETQALSSSEIASTTATAIDTEDSVNQSTSSTEEDAEEATAKKDLVGSAKATVKAKVNPNVNKLSEEEAKKLFRKYYPKKSKSIESKSESTQIKEKKKPLPVKMKIYEITRNGDVVIYFNQKLLVPPYIDRKSTENQGDPVTDKKRELIPLSALNVERDILEFFFILNSDEEQIEFFIEMKEWTETQMTLNLNFTNPMQISRSNIPDVAVVKIKNKQLFKSQESDLTIQNEEIFVRKSFPKQLPSGISEEELQNQAEQASTGVKVLFFVQLAAQISLKGSLDELFTLFFALQIICYLKIYDIPMPSNTEIYINELTKLIEFDVLNLDSVVKNTIDPEFSLTDFILGQSESSYEKDGLEMQSMYQEIKFFLLIAIMVVVFCLVLLIASFFKIFKTKVSEQIKKTKKNFFFNGMIRSITIIYIQICITCGAQLGLWLKNNKTQSREDQIIGLMLFVFLGLFPFGCWLVIISNKKNLEHPEVEGKIGNLYSGVRVKHGKYEHLFYFPMFLIRRIIFVAVPTFLYAYSYFQVQLLLFLTSLYIIFYTGNHPHIDKRRTAIENFNEVMIMIINYHMVCFSEFNLDVQQQFNMGYSLVAVIFFIIGINLISMMSLQVEKSKRHRVLKKNKSAETQVAIKKREFYARLGTLAKSNMDMEQLKNSRLNLIKNKHDFVTHIAELEQLAYDDDQISRIKYPAGYNELINIAPTIIENQEVAKSFREINDMVNLTFGGLQGLAEYNRNSILFQVDKPPTLVDLNNLQASPQQAMKRKKSIRMKHTKKSKTLQLVPPMPEILEMDEQNTIEMNEVPSVDFPLFLAKQKTVKNKNSAILPQSLTQNEENVNIATLLKSSKKTKGRYIGMKRNVLKKKKTRAFIGLTEEDLGQIARRVNDIGIVDSDMKD